MKAKLALRGLLALAATASIACDDPAGPGPDAMTVSGVVVDENMQPQRRAGVLILGHDVVETDEDGRFSVSGVEPPYDLATALLRERGAMIYMGLTRDDPMVVLPPDPSFPPVRSARVTGEVSPGAGHSWPQDHVTSVMFESPETDRWVPVDGDRTFDLTAVWRGTAGSTTGTLHALQWQFDPDVGLPTEYAYGSSSSVNLVDGESLDRSVELAPVDEGSVEGTVTTPDGHTLTSVSLHMGFGVSPDSETALEIFADEASAEDFSYVTPIIPGATLSLRASAAVGEARSETLRTGISADAADVALRIPVAPVLTEPGDGYQEVNWGTRYSWTGMNDAVHLLAIRYVGRHEFIPEPPNFYFFTTESSAALPDLGPLGMFYHRNSEYRWEVYSWGPFESTDEIAAEGWFIPDGDRNFGRSAPYRFSVQR